MLDVAKWSSCLDDWGKISTKHWNVLFSAYAAFQCWQAIIKSQQQCKLIQALSVTLSSRLWHEYTTREHVLLSLYFSASMTCGTNQSSQPTRAVADLVNDMNQGSSNQRTAIVPSCRCPTWLRTSVPPCFQPTTFSAAGCHSCQGIAPTIMKLLPSSPWNWCTN